MAGWHGPSHPAGARARPRGPPAAPSTGPPPGRSRAPCTTSSVETLISTGISQRNVAWLCEKGLYRPQKIRSKPLGQGDMVEVSWGLKPGDKVVTAGAFLLNTEIMKGSIEAGCCTSTRHPSSRSRPHAQPGDIPGVRYLF